MINPSTFKSLDSGATAMRLLSQCFHPMQSSLRLIPQMTEGRNGTEIQFRETGNMQDVQIMIRV